MAGSELVTIKVRAATQKGADLALEAIRRVFTPERVSRTITTKDGVLCYVDVLLNLEEALK